MNYTEGEWKAWVTGIHLSGEPTIPNRIALTFQQSFMDTGEAQANACMMAVAPDMYETGLDLLEVMCKLCRRLNPQHKTCQSCEEIESYRKAFAKAGGK